MLDKKTRKKAALLLATIAAEAEAYDHPIEAFKDLFLNGCPGYLAATDQELLAEITVMVDGFDENDEDAYDELLYKSDIELFNLKKEMEAQIAIHELLTKK